MGGDPHEFVPSERIGPEASLPCATSVPLSGGGLGRRPAMSIARSRPGEDGRT